MTEEFFAGAYGGDVSRLPDNARLECKICWYVYEPDQGDDYWQIPAGTPFSGLPEHWTCPECDSSKEGFLLIEENAA